jgi:riboflavin transporter FmnP
MKNEKVRHIALVAIFGAVAFVLMFFSFNIPFLSPFAEIDLSAVMELMGGFLLGPIGGAEIIVLKVLLKLLFKGSGSMLTGEIQNILLEMAFVIPAAIFYKKHKTKKGAIFGMVLGAFISVIVSIFTNVYLILPFYMKLYEMDWDAIIEIFTNINPVITNIPTIIIFSVVPFNVVSRVLTSLITLVLYKKVSRLIKE